MRILPKPYLDLYAGLSRIRELDQQFQAEWKRPVALWNRAADREYAQLSVETEQARADWAAVKDRMRPSRMWGWALLAFGLLFACPAFFCFNFSLGFSNRNVLTYLPLAAAALIVTTSIFFGVRFLTRAAAAERRVAQEIMKNPGIRFDPKRPRSLPNPQPPERRKVPALTELTGLWWKQLEAEAAEGRVVVQFGDQGELDLLDALKRILPNSYVTMWKLMVARNLDVDVLLLGPTGVWNLESKYFSGEVTYADGQWQQTKNYYGEGGIPVQEVKPVDPLHRQWLRERDLLYKRLDRALPDWQIDIKGGLVFTLPDVTFNIDASLPVAVGTTADWIKIIRAAPVDPAMTEERIFRMAGVLLAMSHSFEDVPVRSSVRLAETIYRQQVESLQAYVSEKGRSL